LFQEAKSGEVIVGAENLVEQWHCAAVIAGIEDERTAGWRIVEMAVESPLP
jgi:import inner membrane translocase subunit TIM44